MKIQYIKSQTGNHYFNIDGVTLTAWTSFNRSIIALESYGHSHNFNKDVFKEGDTEDIINFFKSNEVFTKTFIAQAIAKQKIDDAYNQLPKKHLVTISENNEILIVKIDLSRNSVSVCYDAVVPESYDYLVETYSPNLVDHYVNEQGMSENQAKKLVADGIRNNGIEEVVDVSLFSDSFEFKGEDYYFSSIGCGPLSEKEAKKYFTKNKELVRLIELHRLSVTSGHPDMVEALWLYTQIKGSPDYKKEVIEAGLKIVRK